MLWLTSSANAHTVDDAFQLTMAIFGIVSSPRFPERRVFESLLGVVRPHLEFQLLYDGSTETIDVRPAVDSFDSDLFWDWRGMRSHLTGKCPFLFLAVHPTDEPTRMRMSVGMRIHPSL